MLYLFQKGFQALVHLMLLIFMTVAGFELFGEVSVLTFYICEGVL